MAFWAYLLHCRGGLFYAGQTDDLERRIAEHRSGLVPGFTADHQPVELVWSERFLTRDEAKAAERKLKGWSRAKKLAMIRGDWAKISMLAKGKNSPSTSSGKTEALEGVSSVTELRKPLSPHPAHPEPVEGLSFSLLPHPHAPPLGAETITARINADDPHWLRIRWRIEGAAALIISPFAGKGRADGLWQATCFELFIRTGDGEGYCEFNLSPSERWAAYDFITYREGMTDRPMPRDPVCTLRRGGKLAIFDAAIPRSALPALPWRFGLSAVIEEEAGVKSYWALAHPEAKPDFHDPACFAGVLPAREAP
jgi:predicted GIY-YIG superfamily endonuclease